MNKLVTFTRQNGENEYTEFSYFTIDGLTNQDYINEVYFGYDDLSEMEDTHRDTSITNKEVYWFGDELISVHKVEDITNDELTVLRKFWIV